MRTTPLRAGLLIAALVTLALVTAAGSPAGIGAAGGAGTARAASCPWMNAALPANTRAQMLLGAMSLSDKIAMVHQPEPDGFHYGAAGWIPANASLCIPDLVLNDAGQGVGDQQVGTTAFPAPIAQSASWDKSLQYQFGAALGQEAAGKGINVQLAPGIETQRVPMNGRNWEYASEDPFLSGQVGSAEVQGMQSQHVIAVIKHFIANSQETDRMTDSSDLSERTLEEMYAPQYEAAVRQGGAGAVMCSYNRINSVYSCEDPSTLGMLDNQFGFSGFVVSDWGATHSTVASAKAGLDMEMNETPGTYYGSALQTAVQDGQVPMSTLNDMVLRILRSMFRIGLFDHPVAAQPGAYGANVSTSAHVALARTISEAGTVLLKNQDGILPLTGNGKTIALIGQQAGPGGAEIGYDGEGSGHVPEFGAVPVVSPEQGITTRAASNGDTVVYADGSATADAVAAAKAASVAIVFAGDSESEGIDRPNLTLTGGVCELEGCTPQTYDQNALISAVAAANPNTIVVLNTGGPVLMPWLSSIKGLFEAWYPGQEDGDAIAALLFGDVDPSARLPETFPASQSDIPEQSPAQWPGVNQAGDSVGPHSQYSEGLLVGYRWYDAKGIKPLFPFGFGLDYTSFHYSGMGLHATSAGGDVAQATIHVANTGSRAGADVPQLYIEDPPVTGEPPRQLQGYSRVSLSPGGSATVTIPFGARALSWWNFSTHTWTVSRGCYTVAVGPNERDIEAHEILAVNGAHCPGAAAAITVGEAAYSCYQPSGQLKGTQLGPVRLGMARARVRRQFRKLDLRGRRYMDFFCTGQSGIRVGYASNKLLRSLPRRQRGRLRGHAVLILTSTRRFALRGVHPNTRLAKVARRLHVGRPFVIGRNRWYLVADGRARGVMKVRHGLIEEVGIANRSLTNPRPRAKARRFLSSFS
ncbi:MAG: glycoside hydrolase family 3 C-terminal domain-containing protein [Solirubrobacteraceae bacterium]